MMFIAACKVAVIILTIINAVVSFKNEQFGSGFFWILAGALVAVVWYKDFICNIFNL